MTLLTGNATSSIVALVSILDTPRTVPRSSFVKVDVDTTQPSVIDTYYAWIGDLVTTYSSNPTACYDSLPSLQP